MRLGLRLLVLLWVLPAALLMPLPETETKTETEEDSRGQREGGAPQTRLKELLQCRVRRDSQSQIQTGPKPNQNHKTTITVRQKGTSGCLLSTCVHQSLLHRLFLSHEQDKKACAPPKKIQQYGRRRRALACLEGAPEKEGPEREGPEQLCYEPGSEVTMSTQ